MFFRTDELDPDQEQDQGNDGKVDLSLKFVLRAVSRCQTLKRFARKYYFHLGRIMELRPGTPSPIFNLKDKDGVSHKLDSVKSKYTVVYFYPKDDTPGCTLEAKDFSDTLPKFKTIGATVIGVSGGDSKSKAKFCSKHKLSLTLVSDPDYKVSKRFGAYGKKSFMGRSYVGVLRKTFVLDEQKRVVKVYDSVKPEGHAQAVLSFLATAGRQAPFKTTAPKKAAKSVAVSAAKAKFSGAIKSAKKAAAKKVAAKKKPAAKKTTKRKSPAKKK